MQIRKATYSKGVFIIVLQMNRLDKMKRLAKIVDGEKLFTIFANAPS